jgi:hypothetical protein
VSREQLSQLRDDLWMVIGNDDPGPFHLGFAGWRRAQR